MDAQNYELMVVINPKQDPSLLVSKLEKFIKGAQAHEVKIEKMGKKTLAYPIAKQQEAEYFLFNFEAPPEAISAISQNLRLERETILRYLFTKVSKVSKSGRVREVKETGESEAKNIGRVIVKTKSNVTGVVTKSAKKVSKAKKIKSPASKAKPKGTKVKEEKKAGKEKS